MSREVFVAPLETLTDRRISPAALRVLLALYSYRSNANPAPFPSVETVSELLGMHPRTVQHATAELERLGWLVKEGVGGRGNTNRYRLKTVAVSPPFNPLKGGRFVPKRVAVSPPPIKGRNNQENNQDKYIPPIVPPSILPLWISPHLWAMWVDHRKALGAPMTPHAETLILAKLKRYRDEGHDPEEILKRSIEHGWKSVFEPKEHHDRPHRHRSKADLHAERIRETLDAIQREREVDERRGTDPLDLADAAGGVRSQGDDLGAPGGLGGGAATLVPFPGQHRRRDG